MTRNTSKQLEGSVDLYFKLRPIENAVITALTNPIYIEDVDGKFSPRKLADFAMVELLATNILTSQESTAHLIQADSAGAQKFEYYHKFAVLFAKQALANQALAKKALGA